MNYCVTYNNSFRYKKEVDEIILEGYSGSDSILTRIPELINKNQKVILDLSWMTKPIEEVAIYINKLRADGYNVIARISYGNTETREKLKEAGIPFFFNTFCINMEMAYTQAKMGASEIYVVEELGFRLKDLQYIRNSFPVKIRVIPNICQSQDNKTIGTMESFWIRPEDTELYEPYVDTFEIVDWNKEDRPGSRLSILYEIYKQRQWLGTLNDIILDFDSSSIVNNTGINPHFGEMRINCGKRCLQGKCHLCGQAASLAEAFSDKGIELIKAKYKVPLTEEKIKETKEFLDEHRTNQDIDNPKYNSSI